MLVLIGCLILILKYSVVWGIHSGLAFGYAGLYSGYEGYVYEVDIKEVFFGFLTRIGVSATIDNKHRVDLWLVFGYRFNILNVSYKYILRFLKRIFLVYFKENKKAFRITKISHIIKQKVSYLAIL